MATRAAIYCRISDDGEGTGLGVQRQQEDALALATAKGWTVDPDDMYIDNDISASTLSKKRRPEYDRLMRGIQDGRIKALAYYSNSRLTRRPMEWIQIIELARNGLQLASVASGQHDLTTADGRAVALTIAAWDAAEAERTSERIRRTQRQRREMALPTGGRRMFGYKAPETGVRGYNQEVDPVEAKALRDAMRDILAGASCWSIVKEWNRREIKTATGRDWRDASTVKRHLMNPTLAGLITHKGEVIGEGTWPAILSRADQEALRTEFDRRERLRTPAKPPQRHILSGMVFCQCGAGMHAQVYVAGPGKSSKGHNRYTCMTNRGGCGTVTRHKPWIEAMVETALETLLTDAPVASNAETPEGVAEAGMVTRIEHLESLNADTHRRMNEGLIDPEDGWPAISERRSEIKQLRSKLAKLAKDRAVVETGELGPAEALAIYRNPKASWSARRRVLQSHIEKVIVLPLPKGNWGAWRDLPKDSIVILPRRR